MFDWAGQSPDVFYFCHPAVWSHSSSHLSLSLQMWSTLWGRLHKEEWARRRRKPWGRVTRTAWQQLPSTLHALWWGRRGDGSWGWLLGRNGKVERAMMKRYWVFVFLCWRDRRSAEAWETRSKQRLKEGKHGKLGRRKSKKGPMRGKKEKREGLSHDWKKRKKIHHL